MGLCKDNLDSEVAFFSRRSCWKSVGARFIRVQKFLVRQVQSTMIHDMSNLKGRYLKLNPSQLKYGLWVVGSQIYEFNPLALSPCGSPQLLSSSNHSYTHHQMRDAHVSSGHRGRDATLAKFRQCLWMPQGLKLAKVVKFRQCLWMPQGSKIAKVVRDRCQLCKLREPRVLQQEMGCSTISQCLLCLLFTSVMLDLFGSVLVCRAVQKRISGKAIAVIFTDLASSAIHIEISFGYDTDAFLLALTRFTAVHGWPSVINSDPESQLVCADKKISKAWRTVDRSKLNRLRTEKGLRWEFSPSGSP